MSMTSGEMRVGVWSLHGELSGSNTNVRDGVHVIVSCVIQRKINESRHIKNNEVETRALCLRVTSNYHTMQSI